MQLAWVCPCSLHSGDLLGHPFRRLGFPFELMVAEIVTRASTVIGRHGLAAPARAGDGQVRLAMVAALQVLDSMALAMRETRRDDLEVLGPVVGLGAVPVVK